MNQCAALALRSLGLWLPGRFPSAVSRPPPPGAEPTDTRGPGLRAQLFRAHMCVLLGLPTCCPRGGPGAPSRRPLPTGLTRQPVFDGPENRGAAPCDMGRQLRLVSLGRTSRRPQAEQMPRVTWGQHRCFPCPLPRGARRGGPWAGFTLTGWSSQELCSPQSTRLGHLSLGTDPRC